jgi:cytochrome P450
MDIVLDPVGLVRSCRAEFGDLFAIRIPFHFDLTYITTRDGYEQLTSMSADVGRMGPVMQRLLAVGFGYRRSDTSAAYLQELMLLGRTFMRDEVLSPAVMKRVRPRVRALVAKRTANWSGRVDLSRELVRLIHNAAGLCVSGDDLWAEIGEETTECIRDIVESIDVPRVALASTPLRWLMPEYRQTRRLERVLDRAIAKHEREDCFPLIGQIQRLTLDGRILHRDDVSWMLMYVLWNALNYPGSYGFWSFVEAIEDAPTRSRLEAASAKTRRPLLALGLWETLRRHPVSSLVRANSCPVQLMHQGQSYEVPVGGYVGVFPRSMNRDPEVYDRPDDYHPDRYIAGEPLPEVFGRGAFGCIAHRFVKELLVTVEEALLTQHQFTLDGPVPERVCRVHLLLPTQPVHAIVQPRLGDVVAKPDLEQASRCPITGWMRR